MHPADKIIRARKAVYPKFFTKAPIEEPILWEILESANWAPTHKMTEPWRFIVMRGEKLKELGDFMAEAYRASVSPERFSERKMEEKRQKPLQSGAVIAILRRRDPGERLPEWEELAAVATAVENLWISATAHGLGGYWSSPGAIIGRPEILNLEEGEHCYGLFYLGHHNMPEIPRQRGDIREKVRWEG